MFFLFDIYQIIIIDKRYINAYVKKKRKRSVSGNRNENDLEWVWKYMNKTLKQLFEELHSNKIQKKRE